MFSGLKEYISPSTRGVLEHSAAWLAAPSTDISHQNPNARDDVAIYCIHGTADRVLAFDKIATYITQHFPANVASIHLVTFEKRFQGNDIISMADQLRQKIITNKHTKVVMMGHSRGGLVAAYFTEYLAASANIQVQQVFAIGSPFHGSDLAVWPFTVSSSVKQMTRNNDFLADLRERVSRTSVKYHFFAAKNDHIVSVDSAQVAGEQHHTLIFENHGHLSMISSDDFEVAKYAVNVLLGPEPKPEPLSDMNDEKLSECDMVMIDHSAHKELAAIHAELDEQINRFKKYAYLKWSSAHIDILVNLKELIEDAYEGKRSVEYAQLRTVGDLIRQYQANHLTAQEKLKSLTMFTEPVTYSLSLIYKDSTHQAIQFMQKLASSYQKTPLPAPQEAIILVQTPLLS